MRKAVFFDLDNTLYDAAQYFSSAFTEISNYLSERYKISNMFIFDRLMELWSKKTSMFPTLFDIALKELGAESELKNVVNIFNNCGFKIKPYREVKEILGKLKKSCLLGIITDGNIDRQKRKIEKLGIVDFFDILIYTLELNSPKPSEVPFREALSKTGISPRDCYYIADNPIIDFKGAKKTGMKTIRLKKGEFSGLPLNEFIDIEINEINEIPKLLSEF